MKSSIRRARQRNEDAIAANVERLMSDIRFTSLRTRRARVALVVILAALIVAMVPAWALGGSIVGVVAVVAAAITWWLLRLSVREVADLPDRFLDERQRAVRNEVYVEAYRWFSAVMVVLGSAGLVAFIALGQDPDTWSVDLTWNACMAMFWTVIGSALGLPSMVLALRDREDVLLATDE